MAPTLICECCLALRHRASVAFFYMIFNTRAKRMKRSLHLFQQFVAECHRLCEQWGGKPGIVPLLSEKHVHTVVLQEEKGRHFRVSSHLIPLPAR